MQINALRHDCDVFGMNQIKNTSSVDLRKSIKLKLSTKAIVIFLSTQFFITIVSKYVQSFKNIRYPLMIAVKKLNQVEIRFLTLLIAAIYIL